MYPPIDARYKHEKQKCVSRAVKAISELSYRGREGGYLAAKSRLFRVPSKDGPIEFNHNMQGILFNEMAEKHGQGLTKRSKMHTGAKQKKGYQM